MEPGNLLPKMAALGIEWIRLAHGAVQIGLASRLVFCNCPACGRRSSRVHSHYVRILGDLPAHGRVIQLQLRVRRFFCDFPDCRRQTFAEPFSEVTNTHWRRTFRLTQALRQIGFAAGGECGARLAGELGMPISPDTLLRLMRRTPLSAMAEPRVLGVDDWAFHRSQRYGTILCDLELHRPIDLLPERSASILAAWLKQHPGVEIISRDRSSEYARGATLGAPQAKQVADRWHLLHNLIEAFDRALDRNHAILTQTAKELDQAVVSGIPPAAAQTPVGPVWQVPILIESSKSPSKEPSRRQLLQEQRRARRLAHFEHVKDLQTKGIPLLTIAKQLHLARGTVRRYARTEQFPERSARQGTCIVSRTPCRRSKAAGPLDSHLDYLKRRWDEGCHKAAQLYREIKDKGFTGSHHMVRRRVASWRQPGESGQTGGPSEHQPAWHPSPRTVTWLLLKPNRKRSVEQEIFLTALRQRWPELMENVALIQEFRSVLCQRRPEDLNAWASLADEPSIMPEIRRFAHNLQQDWEAVMEAIRQPWSNGQVEGQVNRLKLIKRQMYGRANFDLLRQRVLHGN